MIKPELLLLSPKDPGRARKLAARMVELGVFFPFEGAYQLPTRLPGGLRGFKLIVAPDDRPLPSAPLRRFERNGGRVIRLAASDWTNGSFIERIPVMGGLRLQHPGMFAQMEAVPDELVFRACLHWSMVYGDLAWNDVLRYNIECLLESYELTREPSILKRAGFVVRKALAGRPPTPGSCDPASCAYPLLRYFERAGNARIVSDCRSFADEYLARAPRYLGVLSNFVRPQDAGILRSEIAFQACAPLARLARVSGESRYRRIAIEQLFLLDRYLRDARTGLWRLGRGPAGQTAGLWGRGCAFSLRGVLDTLTELPADDPAQTRLRKIVQRMVRALAQLQTKEGFWCQLLGENPGRPECSATAWTTAAVAKAIRLGVVGREFLPVARKGWLATKRRIWDGLPVAITVATTASADLEYYRHRPVSEPNFGHFPLLAAIEMLRLKRTAGRKR
jgi:rhamnogalacturonyl hydrolase YesR